MTDVALARLAGRRHLHVGPVDVHSYKVALYVGCVAGVYAGSAMAATRGLDPSRFAFTTIGLLVPALVGARLWYVARHAGFLRAEPTRLFRRADGGAGLFGGLVVGVLVSIPVLAVVGMSFWAFWDGAVVTMLVGLACTRVGCLMNGCCGGRPTNSRLALRLPGIDGTWARRYPTQLLEAAMAVLLLLVAAAVHGVAPTGTIFAGVVACYCVARAALQPLRAA